MSDNVPPWWMRAHLRDYFSIIGDFFWENVTLLKKNKAGYPKGISSFLCSKKGFKLFKKTFKGDNDLWAGFNRRDMNRLIANSVGCKTNLRLNSCECLQCTENKDYKVYLTDLAYSHLYFWAKHFTEDKDLLAKFSGPHVKFPEQARANLEADRINDESDTSSKGDEDIPEADWEVEYLDEDDMTYEDVEYLDEEEQEEPENVPMEIETTYSATAVMEVLSGMDENGTCPVTEVDFGENFKLLEKIEVVDDATLLAMGTEVDVDFLDEKEQEEPENVLMEMETTYSATAVMEVLSGMDENGTCPVTEVDSGEFHSNVIDENPEVQQSAEPPLIEIPGQFQNIAQMQLRPDTEFAIYSCNEYHTNKAIVKLNATTYIYCERVWALFVDIIDVYGNSRASVGAIVPKHKIAINGTYLGHRVRGFNGSAGTCRNAGIPIAVCMEDDGNENRAFNLLIHADNRNCIYHCCCRLCHHLSYTTGIAPPRIFTHNGLNIDINEIHRLCTNDQFYPIAHPLNGKLKRMWSFRSKNVRNCNFSRLKKFTSDDWHDVLGLLVDPQNLIQVPMIAELVVFVETMTILRDLVSVLESPFDQHSEDIFNNFSRHFNNINLQGNTTVINDTTEALNFMIFVFHRTHTAFKPSYFSITKHYASQNGIKAISGLVEPHPSTVVSYLQNLPNNPPIGGYYNVDQHIFEPPPPNFQNGAVINLVLPPFQLPLITPQHTVDAADLMRLKPATYGHMQQADIEQALACKGLIITVGDAVSMPGLTQNHQNALDALILQN